MDELALSRGRVDSLIEKLIEVTAQRDKAIEELVEVQTRLAYCEQELST